MLLCSHVTLYCTTCIQGGCCFSVCLRFSACDHTKPTEQQPYNLCGNVLFIVTYNMYVQSEANRIMEAKCQNKPKQNKFRGASGSLSTHITLVTSYFSSSVQNQTQSVNTATKQMQKAIGPPPTFRLFQIPCSWYFCLQS